MSHACASQSIPIVTAYDSLGPEGLKHSMKQTGSKAIFLDPNLVGTLANVIEDVPGISHVIYNTEPESKTLSEDLQKLKSKRSSLTVQSFDELQKAGADKPVDPVPPTPDDIACIMYTSGSTGPPKGVILKQRQVIGSLAGIQSIVAPYLGPKDAILTYLPQSHILEFVFENACLYWGCIMGYGNPKTLSDASVRNCKGDIREFQPTILIGVPAVWESVKKGIVGKVNAGSFVVKNMFWGALSLKQTLLGTGLPGAGLLDAIVFKKLKDATGGRLRVAFSGGGPISQETVKFISYAVTPMISGYGLTETSAMGCIQDPLAWDPTALGDITGCIEVKLVDFADAGYFSTNNPPQGEVWIRGPAVTEGYWDNEKETQEALTEDGWFKTGDIGEFNPNGHLKIIDRKKNLVKTLNGEYIAIEKLESTYKTASVVGNVCVYAASDKAKPIAIVVPVEAALQKLASENGVEGGSLEELAHNKKMKEAVLKELQKTGRNLGLQGIELIEGVVLADEEWTPQNVSKTAPLSHLLLTITLGFRFSRSKASEKEDSGPLQEGSRRGLWRLLSEKECMHERDACKMGLPSNQGRHDRRTAPGPTSCQYGVGCVSRLKVNSIPNEHSLGAVESLLSRNRIEGLYTSVAVAVANASRKGDTVVFLPMLEGQARLGALPYDWKSGSLALGNLLAPVPCDLPHPS
jgi:long-chain acyl-CoA synthetase